MSKYVSIKYSGAIIGSEHVKGIISVPTTVIKLKNGWSEIKAADLVREYLKHENHKDLHKLVDLKVEILHGE